MPQYLLAIDQGTTSSRAVIFTVEGNVVAEHQLEFKQYYPKAGWVEHDPEEIWQSTLTCCQHAIRQSQLTVKEITAIGISNQRETTIIWDKNTGKAIYPAIVWQDRRTTDYCHELASHALVNETIKHKTGLLLDPYFSATKIAWVLDHVEGARQRASQGDLLFGTVDTFLIWRLTKGKRHVTDATNASRTLLFNIREQRWANELLSLFNIPHAILPTVLDNCADFGECNSEYFGHAISITGVAGDQQAATIGQAAFKPGMIKSTYGTGCFVLLNTGDQIVVSENQLLSTMAYRINGSVTYGLEGSIFNAGTTIQWLRDSLHLIQKSSECGALAASITDNHGVYLVPAFTGLGAPYWDPNARGALLGLTRNSGIAEIVRAALEAVCYQTRDLMQAMTADYHGSLATLRVDGGMVANDWLLQFLSDILNLPVERPACIETSALGAAYLAGLGAGIYQSLDEIAERWHLQQRFTPNMPSQQREQLYHGWQRAVHRVI